MFTTTVLLTKTTKFLSISFISILLGYPASLLADDEVLTKEGRLVRNPTPNNPTSEIDWVITHENNTDGLMENVILTDQLSDGQAMLPGSLQMPEGWTVQYSIDQGASFSTIEPDDGVNALIFSNPYVVPTDLGRGRSMTLPVSVAVNLSGGGDGYNPALLDNGRIMGINHHSRNPNIWCYDTRTEAKCEGYPKRPGIPTGHDPLAIAIGSKLYIGDDSTYKSYGQKGKIYCWDADADRTCGSSKTIPGGGYSGPVHLNGKLYVLTKAGEIDCYDPNQGLAQCSDFTRKKVGVVPGSTFSWTSSGSDMLTWNGRIYFASSQGLLGCFDTQTNNICSDWASSPITISGSATGFDLFRRMDASGTVTGFCTGGYNLPAVCYDFNGTNPETINDLSGRVGHAGLHSWGETYYETRVFFPIYFGGKISCWDWSTRTACSGENFVDGVVGTVIRPYALSTDQSCVYGFGDAGILKTWDPETGASPCLRSAGKISVDMDQYFCKEPADETARWDKVSFYDTNMTKGTDFDSLIINLLDTKTGDVVKGPIEMIDGNGEVDISDIPASIRSLTLSPVGRPVGKNAWNDGSPPKVALTFSSNEPMRFCYSASLSCGDGGDIIGTRSFRNRRLVSNTIRTNITPGLSVRSTVAACNLAPTIRTPAALNYASLNTAIVVDISSIDDSSKESPLGDGLVYSLSGGDDVGFFNLDSVGQLSFKNPPDINNPLDANGDNVYLVEVTVRDADGSSTLKLFNISVVLDSDLDGIPDEEDLDIDGDGIANDIEGDDDTDGDGVADKFDLDSDNDGITDALEAQPFDNYQAPSGNDFNQDGIDDIYGQGLTPWDSDSDGKPNAYDTDDDNDSLLTKFEQLDPNESPAPGDVLDTDQDGVPNFLDNDDDGDGKPTQDELNGTANNGVFPFDAPDQDGDETPDYLDETDMSLLVFKVKGLLQGAYDQNVGLMRDDLGGFLPLGQPYTDQLTSLGYNGEETLSTALLGVGGDNAIVDWVLVELRSATDATQRVIAFAGVIQRDGDVADAQSNNTLLKIPSMESGSYYVALRHRNHLGVMTREPVELSSTLSTIDFTRLDVEVNGTHARTSAGDTALLWAGDTNNDDKVIHFGPDNDSNGLLGTVLIHPGNEDVNTNYALPGYYVTDLNLDGITLYSGPNNDINLISYNVLLHPDNPDFTSNFIVKGSMPR